MEDENTFVITYSGYEPENETVRETLTTLGNGYFATRGAHESSRAGDSHYPGTYMAGGYNRLKTKVSGEVVENEDLVNWPNWLLLTFRIADGEWFSLDQADILEYEQILDMGRGVLECDIKFKDDHDRITRLKTTRFVHMNAPHTAGIQWVLTPQNWSGQVTVHSAIDGTVENSGVKRYRALNSNHLEPLGTGQVSEDGIYLEVQTRQSHLRMSQAVRTNVFEGEDIVPHKRETVSDEGYIAQELTFEVKECYPVRVEKIASIYTIKDVAISEPALAACKTVERVGDIEELLNTHHKAWRHLWERFDVKVGGDPRSQTLVHLHIFHILQTASPNTYELDVGIPPRGLHGEAYRGHILWDELFVFPYLNLRNPLLTREFLLYRYHRLDEARHMARQAGYRGAMFPWQSGSSGREENQRIHLNPASGRWVPDVTHLQRHVNVAIVYNIWQYFQVTDDKDFFYYFGAEVIFEIAKFWSSIARYNPQRERFEIHGVIGPDEYHTAYPGAQKPGINNNAYTNFMAAWVVLRALDTLNILDEHRGRELCEDLEIDDEELNRWEWISNSMYIPFVGDTIEQFEGYDKLEELDWDKYREKYGENIRLDRVLESENDSVDRYKASKQADVLMLFYLFSADELTERFKQMRYSFDPSNIPRMIHYYRQRTSHGSTLSRLVFSWVLSRSDRNRSWNVFTHALVSDFEDVQGGTTSEGIHLGAMAGTVDMVQRCYTGLEIRNDVLYFTPQLPESISEIRQRIRYRSHWISITLDHEKLKVSFEKGWGNPVKLNVEGEEFTFREKETKEFKL
ncbi:MAG: glycoside hydrolase family 65 protein [Chitinispirillaceae bacterium]